MKGMKAWRMVKSGRKSRGIRVYVEGIGRERNGVRALEGQIWKRNCEVNGGEKIGFAKSVMEIIIERDTPK